MKSKGIGLVILILICVIAFSVFTNNSNGDQVAQYNFRSSELYESHFIKHGEEFGDITKVEYLQIANDLINSQSASVLTKYESDGDKLFYDVNNNEFLVLSGDGYIRTLFKPDDGIDYYNRQ